MLTVKLLSCCYDTAVFKNSMIYKEERIIPKV